MIWKEVVVVVVVVVVVINLLSRHLPGEAEEKYEEPQSG
jgi:hypothetical protein